MRYDRVLDTMHRHRGRGVSALPAEELCKKQEPQFRLTGKQVADLYGFLLHFTSGDGISRIVTNEQLGPGCWLTPLGISGCLAPYNLGLPVPKNRVLLVDTTEIGELWGPGKAPPSPKFGGIWRGGGIEFYCREPIPLTAIRSRMILHPCGDTYHG